MKYCPGELLQSTKKSTLNFWGLSLLYCLTGFILERDATPPSSKLKSIPGMNVDEEALLSVFSAWCIGDIYHQHSTRPPLDGMLLLFV